MTFLRVLIDSFVLLKKSPAFFIPKIVIAFLFLPGYMMFSMIVVQAMQLLETGLTAFPPEEIISLFSNILVGLLFATAYMVIINIVDSVFVNPMYPAMVRQYYKRGKISFRHAFKVVVKRLKAIILSLAIVTLIIAGVLTPFLFLIIYAISLRDDILVYISSVAALIVAFAVLTVTYLFYPVGTLEEIGFANVIKKTFKTSYKHKINVIKALTFSAIITLASYLIAFSLEQMRLTPGGLLATLGLFVLLIISRFIIAVVVTYHYVLNAVFYLSLEKGVFLGK